MSACGFSVCIEASSVYLARGGVGIHSILTKYTLIARIERIDSLTYSLATQLGSTSKRKAPRRLLEGYWRLLEGYWRLLEATGGSEEASGRLPTPGQAIGSSFEALVLVLGRQLNMCGEPRRLSEASMSPEATGLPWRRLLTFQRRLEGSLEANL